MKIQNVKKQLTAACRCSYSRLALNVYLFGEMLAIDERYWDSRAVFEQEFLRLMSLFLDGEPVAEALDSLRKQVMKQMEVSTAYTDYFQVYEHVFNRLECRFGISGLLPNSDIEQDQERLQWLMSFITSDEHTTANRRIQQVLGQLPIRLTKQKFFSMVREALNLYKGSEGKSLDDMMYVLRSAGLLNLPQGMENFNPELRERLQRFRQADYKNMTAETCQELAEYLEQTGGMLSEAADGISLLMELINDLYVLALAGAQELSNIPEESSARQVMISVLAYLRSEGELDERLLESIEGSQEICYEEWEACAASLELLEENSRQDPMTDLLCRIRLLLSTSSFMSLEAAEYKPRTVDAGELDRVCGEFTGQLLASWENQPRLVVRAAMAQILSSLPVFFGTLKEVEQYMQGCLASCTDETEKSMSLGLIRQMAELEALDLF